MVAVGFVVRDGETYANGPVAATFLAGRTRQLRHSFAFGDRISCQRGPSRGLLRTDSATHTELDAGESGRLLAGVEAITAGPAQALAASYDFSGHSRLLDLGGGTGSFTGAIAQRYPASRPRSLISPGGSNDQGSVAALGLSDRIATAEGDLLHDAYERSRRCASGECHPLLRWGAKPGGTFAARGRPWRLATGYLHSTFGPSPPPTAEPLGAALMAE